MTADWADRREIGDVDRWAICEGFYRYAVLFHTGQGSKAYRYLGRLERLGFRPSARVERGLLDGEARDVLLRLVANGRHSTGYSQCACRDCFETAFDGGLCAECEEHGCHAYADDCAGHEGECQRPEAYDIGDEQQHSEHESEGVGFYGND